MDEGRKDQIKQPIAPSSFRIGEISAKKTFQELFPQGIPNREELDEEKKVLKATNPDLAKFIEEDLGLVEDGFPGKDATQRYDGYVIGYRALREEAEAQGGVLPKFTKEGLEDYKEDEEETMIKESDAGEYSNRNEGGLKRRKSRLATFRSSAQAFSKIVEENFYYVQNLNFSN